MRNDSWLKGEVFFKALVPKYHPLPDSKLVLLGWNVSEDYFRSREEAEKALCNDKIMWPAEDLGDGVIFVPDPEELTSKHETK